MRYSSSVSVLYAMGQLGTTTWQRGKLKKFVLAYSAAPWSPIGLLRSIPASCLMHVQENMSKLSLGYRLGYILSCPLPSSFSLPHHHFDPPPCPLPTPDITWPSPAVALFSNATCTWLPAIHIGGPVVCTTTVAAAHLESAFHWGNNHSVSTEHPYDWTAKCSIFNLPEFPSC